MNKLLKPARVLILTVFAVLTGCAVTPQNFTPTEIDHINQQDRVMAFAQVEPLGVGAVITLDEAIARALKYNLDQRVRLLEQSLAAGELEAGKYDMLPKLMANAGYSWRDEYSSRYTADPATPRVIDKTQVPHLSVDREHSTADLSLSWNLLDFGASYYTAKQNADKLLIANERRRKAMHTLIQNVRTAYWRALAAEALSERIIDTIKQAERALVESGALVAERVRAPDESLRYQRNLLENLRLMESVDRELASARIELTKLIGLLPGTRIKLKEPQADEQPLDVDMELLEARALMQNADLREEFFNARIAAQDTRKALLRMLPGISFDYGTYYDDDRYLVNEQWNEAGLHISFNLFNLISAPSRMDAAEKNEALAAARRMALQMSLLTQVHLASHQYADALRQYKRADQIFNVDAQLEKIVRGKYQSNMIGEQSRISANVTTILSELRRYQSMSKVQEAIGRLQSSLGMEPNIDSIDNISLTDLRSIVGDWLDRGLNAAAVPVDTGKTE